MQNTASAGQPGSTTQAPALGQYLDQQPEVANPAPDSPLTKEETSTAGGKVDPSEEFRNAASGRGERLCIAFDMSRRHADGCNLPNDVNRFTTRGCCFLRRTASARLARGHQEQRESRPFDGRARTTRSPGARKHHRFDRRHFKRGQICRTARKVMRVA